MLTQLTTVKSRLSLTDTTSDALLTTFLKSISARFDRETNRTLARTENFTQEFDPADTEILAACYPIESVSKFETKISESTGWQEMTPAPDFLIRESCIISLPSPFCILHSSFCIRVIYTGGYVLPDSTPSPGQTPLPPDLESAAVEQVAYWFQRLDKLGIDTTWPHAGTYEKFADQDLLASVRATLAQYTRWSL